MVMHVTVFGSTCERITILRKVNAVDGTEMTSDLCEFVVKNNTVKLHVETTFTSSSGGNILSVLTSSTDHVEFLVVRVIKQRTNDGTSDRLSIVEIADFFQSFRV